MKKKIEKINKEGEIIFQGKNVCLGYSHNSNDLSKGDENKGLLKTGDIGIYDHNKNIRITGRKSRFIKAYGFRINLDEIEKTLIQNGFECACLGKNDKLLIFHTQKNIEKKINNILKNKLNLLSRDISLINIKVIPRTKIGKIDYNRLNEVR